MAQAFIADAIQPCPVQEDIGGVDTGSKSQGGRPVSTSAATAAAAEPNQETLSWKYSETPGSSVSGDTIFEESGVQKPSVPLTVNEPARVDAELDKVINADQNPSKTITVVKWLAMLFMSLAFLTCLTISKLSLLRIGADLMVARSNKSHQLTTTGSGSPGNKSYSNNNPLKAATSPRAETDVLMLVLIILIPYGTTLLRSIFCGGFRSDKPWPRWSALGLCVLGSLLESFGISLFTIDVLSESPRYISVLLMNGVFLVPILVILYNKCRGRSNGASNHRYFTVVMIFALVFEVAGVVLTFVFELSPTKSGLQTSKLWEVPVALVCLSLAWCPAMLRAQMIPRKKTLKELVKRRRITKKIHSKKDDKKDNVQSEEAFHPNQPDSGHVSQTSSIETTDASAHNEGEEEPMSTVIIPEDCMEDSYQMTTEDLIDNPWDLIAMCPEVSARWKSTIITSILKIILVPVFCILLGHLMHIIDVHKLQEGLKNINSSNDMFPAFMVNIFVTLGGYLLGWGACVMCMRISAFAVPLTLATPVALLLAVLRETCNVFISELSVECHNQTHNMTYTLPAALCLYIAQLLSTGFFIYKTQTLVMQKESQIFWLPGYNGIFLEQWMLLDRKNVQTDDASKTPAQLVADTHVFMCTTMYREAPHEMEQLLQSIKGINLAKQESDRNIESHIFFDNGVRGTKLTEFPLQLVSVAKKVLGVTTEGCTRVLTPYGMKLTWKLQTFVKNKTGMVFSIHLKDNRKVKNKKRWSQVMYMSYVLDFTMRELKGATEENTYILATDADVKFSPQSVEALLDLMTRDNSVGAVCARTHPMGSGPVVWYQIFDYAIGHWLQKAANHVLGSVLCCPGCFSVYRAAAIKDVLTTYASSVNEASEFLTKDMGEDRWLCTLMVQSGWKLEYCAAAEDKTYCPEDFDEFFKQRRRWIPSTLANQFLVLSEWNIVSFFNKQMSFMFMLYQAMLLFSTLINPSVCILIIVGGLYYAWGVNQVFSTIMLILVTIVYTIICLKASQKTQLMAAKVLTTVFALIMAAVTIGTAEEIVQEYQSPHIDDLTSTTTTTTTTTHKPNTTKSLLQAAIYSSTTTASHFLAQNVSTTMDPDSEEGPYKLPASVSTLYLGGLTGIFLVTALLHLPEAYCLIHGIWYLLCLPGGNLVLMVYSICNMTDRSWGTREEKQISDFERPATFQENFKSVMKKIFFCWDWKTEETVKVNKSVQAGDDSAEVFSEEGGNGPDGKLPRKESWRTKPVDRSHSFRFHFDGVGDEAVPVGAWLPQNFKRVYAKRFEDNGYEDTSFIGGMNEKELTKIGVKSKAHRNALLEAIRKLPEPEIDPAVPDHVDDWLEMIGLEMYQDNFRRSHIITRNNMEILKAMNSADLTAELGITKQGHLKRLMLAICKLRYPSETERSISQVKYEVEALHTYNLEEINVGENEFWEELRKQRLLPDSVAFAHDHDLRGKLTELRNSTLMVFAISNAIWIILITTLVTKGSLNVLNTNVLGLCFLVIFGLVLCVQFICMIIHRCSTFMHLIARAPYKCGQPYNDAWSFQNSWERKHSEQQLLQDSSDAEAALIKNQYNNEIHRRYRQQVKAKKRPKRSKLDTLSESEEETQRLLRDDPAVNYSALPGPSGKVNRNLAEGYDVI